MKAKEINEECRAIYERLDTVRKKLKYGWKELCLKAYPEVRPFDIAGYMSDRLGDEAGKARAQKSDKAEAEKWYEKYKKILKRKSWEQNKAKETTMLALQELWNGVCKTEKSLQIQTGILPPEMEADLMKLSEEIDKSLEEQIHKDNKQEN